MKARHPGLVVVLSLALAACARPAAPPAAVRGPAPVPPVVARAPAPAPARAEPRPPLPPTILTPEQQALHVLNRLGYGPRPGDVEQVARMGVAAYIDGQLDPRGLREPSVDEALRPYRTATMPSADLAREYPRPPAEVQRKVQAGEMTRAEALDAYPIERRPNRILAEMQAAKVARAVLSERQLEEVMVDFWFNHFNVYALKGAAIWMLPAYEREAIRPHALGRYRDLLIATARHPAMLFYLDNWLSVRDGLVAVAGPNKGRRLGLNENYARELLELHTLGVDGGYTQEDVIAVARCFTGWTIDQPQQGGGFAFRPRAHDSGAKRVLGRVIPAGGGEGDGLLVLDILARHPSTARFVSTKLVRRFVSDDPPPQLVERAAATFSRTDGDIRAVLQTIFTSEEFYSPQAYRSKIKTPLELVVSSVRALDGRVYSGALADRLGGAGTLAQQIDRLGEPLYQAQPPTGWGDRADAWVNTGALLRRMSFALALTQNRLGGVSVALDGPRAGSGADDPRLVLDRLVALVLHGEVTDETARVLAARLDSPEITRVTGDDRVPKSADVGKLAALVLGSPEFQRR